MEVETEASVSVGDTGETESVNIVKEATDSNTIQTTSSCNENDSNVPITSIFSTVTAPTYETEQVTNIIQNLASNYASDESNAACDLPLKSDTEPDMSVQSDVNKKHFSCFERYIPIIGDPDNAADDSLASNDIDNTLESVCTLRPKEPNTFLSVKQMDDDSSSIGDKLDTESMVNHSLKSDEPSPFHPPPTEETMMAPPSVDAADVREFFGGGEMDTSMSESTGFSNLSAGITTHLEATEEARRMYAETDSESNLTTASDAKLSGISTPKRRASISSATDLPPVVHYGSRFPADNLFEYQWPPETGAEWFMLQEQISEYLEVKSFKRKYPELHRRAVDMKEKEFLKERGVVTETQCDLGLTALRSDEVCDLLARDYPDKYQEYARVLHEKEKQNISNKYKQYSVAKVGKDKLAELVKKAVRSAAEFNAHFQRERREERKAYFDLQTMAIHYPKGRYRVLPASATKVSSYPVSLVPGQFQEHFREYTPDELRYFPLRTTVYGAPKKMQAGDARLEASEQSSEDTPNDSPDDDSGSESDDQATSGTESQASAAPAVPPVSIPANVPSPLAFTPADKKKRTPGRPKAKRGPPFTKCRICSEGKDRVQIGITEELVSCSMCKTVGHPTCLELTEEMIPVIKTYPWQCMECKTCVMCMDPYDEDKMMFCDKCDRGYHTFCVGVTAIPTGRWECSTCKSDQPPPAPPTPQPTKAKRGRR